MKSLLWHSNSSHAPTGYGNQTAIFTPKMKAAGYKVSISSFYGREGAPAINHDGIVELPKFQDPYGNDVILTHMMYTKSQVVFSLIDPFALNPEVWGKMPWCAWVPVDCAPVSPENLNAIRHAKWLWSMSKFGQEQLEAAGHKPFYVPHGIDTSVYKPGDRDEARKKISEFLHRDLDGKFMVVTVAANKGSPSRKNFAGMFEAFAMFAKDHPDAMWYLHTDSRGIWSGDDLTFMAKAWGIEDRIIYPPEYNLMLGMFPPQMLNDIYNMADVFYLLSYGEGFGIPIVEAQAAGCPVIVTDGSAMKELCFSGWTVPAIPVQAMQGRFGCRWWMALPPEAAKRLEWAYNRRTDEKMRQKAVEGAQPYEAEVVFKDHMLPAIEKVFYEAVDKLQPVIIPARKKPVTDRRKRKKAKAEAKEEKKPEVVCEPA